MKSSLRARRMAKNHRKLNQQNKLNLVSLMDIFTILVFFLMVNSGDVEVLQSDKNITLPESVSEQKPEMTLMIKISHDDIVVQGRAITTVADALAQDSNNIAALSKELNYQAARSPQLSEQEIKNGRSVVVMGDKKMPYKLLKKIMTTCAETDYRDISLAVNSSPAQLDEASPLHGEG
jgi:biopolymer transport protein ExbD